MSGSGNKYSTHVLELVRNNGISTMESDVDRGFLMFDYFDILIHKELQGIEKQYVNYFSIGDTFNDDQAYKVSYKTLSIYCTGGQDSSPFAREKRTAEEKETRTLSELPFLGIVQISLCKENYIRDNNEPVDIDVFLTECEKKILEMVKHAGCLKKDDLTVIQMYRSSTTGDFCLVIRTDSVEKIYGITLSLSDSQSNSDKALKVRTYTNVGMECRLYSDSGSGRKYATLSDAFIAKHENITFALRFSADCDLLLLLEEYRKEGSKVKVEAAKGLFGRYDYLLHINLKEFSEIYPLLCEKKFGVPELPSEPYRDGIFTLKNILRNPHIKNINERILVELSVSDTERVKKMNSDQEYLDKVKERNERLFRRINDLSRWRCYFAEEDRAFRDLHRGMVGIYKTFSAIGMEKDAYINWLMFCQDMDVLCECLEICLKKYIEMKENNLENEMDRRIHRLRLLKDWRINIQAINQYTRLVQNINYQTYQSPIYEIQTQIDTEKTMVAYRQAMMSYMDSYIADRSLKNKDVVPSIPIMYPDLAKDRVEVIAPFASQKKEDGESVRREIMCTVPSFEYFGRLYDLLPWMIHESSHHLRILKREDRNYFFTKYIFSYIYRVVIENALPELANDSLYRTISRVEQHLVDCMVEITMKDFAKISKEDDFKDFSFERVISEIDTYISILFGGNINFEGKQVQYDINDTEEKIYEFFLNAYREEELLDDTNLDTILGYRQKKLKEDEDRLIESLLDVYFRQAIMTADYISEDEKGIRIEDIQCPLEWFEEKMLLANETLEEAGAVPEAIKDYDFKLEELYRIANACAAVRNGEGTEGKNIQEYLDRVFKYYQKQNDLEGWRKADAPFLNPRAMHVLKNLGLLNDNKDLFCSTMQQVFKNNDYKEIERHKELKTKVYRESFADLLMATSLNIGSFGYCRQVLQTISDARMEEKGYWDDDIDNQRFQIVAAVLLEEELNGLQSCKESLISKDERINRIRLDGHKIIEDGIVYCRYTLKCIYGKLVEAKEIAGDAAKRETVEYFLGVIMDQLEIFLRDIGGKENYSVTYLYILLHGKEEADEISVLQWEKDGYSEITAACQSVKYTFWRLEYFCLGLKNIMQDRYIIVPLDIFEHMKEIRKLIKRDDGKGCKWETDWDCLARPKIDVGKFYNDPKLVFEKTSSQKLENTIDFIQNFYYYNRFKMMEKENQYGIIKKED